MSIELDKRSINHLFGGWGSARNGKLTREWSLMTLLLLISKGRLLAYSVEKLQILEMLIFR